MTNSFSTRLTRRRLVASAIAVGTMMGTIGLPVDRLMAQASGEPIVVGIITSITGSFSSQGESFVNGFNAGLDYVSKGTGVIAGRKIDVRVANDNGDPATGTAAARELMGAGAKFLTGPTSSAVALPVSEIAINNSGTYIAGASGTSALLAAHHNIFVTGSGSWMPNEAIFKVAPDAKKITFIGQDYQFGKDQAALLQALGAKLGITVEAVLLPSTTQDFTAGALQVKATNADLVFVGWQGNGTAQLYQALTDHGIFATTKILTILSSRWAIPTFLQAAGDAASETIVLTPYFEGLGGGNSAEIAMLDYAKKTNVAVDYVHPQGFNAALMIARAIEQTQGELDQAGVAEALEGWTFDSPFGEVTIRPEDHLITVPFYSVNFSMDGNDIKAKVLQVFNGSDLAPAIAKSLK